MQDCPHSNNRIQPRLIRRQVVGQPIRKLFATHNGTKGAYYETFGIELANGLILNARSPESAYEVDATTRVVSPGYDLYKHQPPQTKIELAGEPVSLVEFSSEKCDDLPAPIQFEDRTLQNLIYYFEEELCPHYFTILDSGDYLTYYHAFNFTEFAAAHFRDWRLGMTSRLSWGRFDLTEQSFFDAWEHTPIDPFSLYT